MFDYDVFGTPLQDRPERFRHGFTGKEFDNWTGLYNYGFRDYSAMFGRFTSVDPIQDGHNWYAYVNSDPVSWLDLWGLECPDQESGEDQKKNAESLEENDKYLSILPDAHKKYEDRNQIKEERVLWMEGVGEDLHETELNGGLYQISASSKLPVAGDFSLDVVSGKVGKDFSSDGIRMALSGSLLSVSGTVGIQQYSGNRHFKFAIGGSAGATWGYEFQFKLSEGIIIDVGWILKPRIEIMRGKTNGTEDE